MHILRRFDTTTFTPDSHDWNYSNYLLKFMNENLKMYIDKEVLT